MSKASQRVVERFKASVDETYKREFRDVHRDLDHLQNLQDMKPIRRLLEQPTRKNVNDALLMMRRHRAELAEELGIDHPRGMVRDLENQMAGVDGVIKKLTNVLGDANFQ